MHVAASRKTNACHSRLVPGVPAGARASSPRLSHYVRCAAGVGRLCTPTLPETTGFRIGGGLPWQGETEATPCRLEFSAPLRLLRQGLLIASPTPADIVLAALHRVCALAGPDTAPLWAGRRHWLELARAVSFEPWQGRRLDLVRYSGSQKAEVELRGVAGSLALPAGPSPISSLLAAPAWIHIGKGT